MTGYLDLAATLVKQLEGCRLVGYLDSTGHPTIGYGHTGPEVEVGKPITQEVADHDLAVDLATANQRLVACIKPGIQLKEHQWAALVSFVFNLGAEPQWTIWKDLDTGNLADVPTQMRRFDKGMIDGKLEVIPGLDHRREAEISFWNTADAGPAALEAAAQAPPSSYTRDIVTPPTPTPAPPNAMASLGAKVTAGVAGLGGMASQIHDIAAPHADEAHVFSALAIAAAGVVVACSIYGVIIHGEQAKARTV